MWDNPSWLLFGVFLFPFHLKQMLKKRFSLFILYHNPFDSRLSRVCTQKWWFTSLILPWNSQLFAFFTVRSIIRHSNTHTHAIVVRFLLIILLFLFSCVCMRVCMTWKSKMSSSCVLHKNFVVLRFVSGERLCWRFFILNFSCKNVANFSTSFLFHKKKKQHYIKCSNQILVFVFVTLKGT